MAAANTTKPDGSQKAKRIKRDIRTYNPIGSLSPVNRTPFFPLLFPIDQNKLSRCCERENMCSSANKVWEMYMLQLQKHPLRTKSITAGLLAGVSDSVAQKLSGIQRIQLNRLLLKMFFGFAYGGPFGHYLHKLLDKIFKGKKDKTTVAKKVLLEQVTSSPWNNLLFLLYFGFVVEGKPWPQVKNKIKKDYPSVQLTSWMFWPVVGWINHQYMPLQFRVIFHSLVACCWGIFLNLRARTVALTKK